LDVLNNNVEMVEMVRFPTLEINIVMINFEMIDNEEIQPRHKGIVVEQVGKVLVKLHYTA